jgi:predicted CoA-substrate-specific enzyme activase
MTRRYVGVDLGAETIKIVELRDEGGKLEVHRRLLEEHLKEPARVLVEMLDGLDWGSVTAAATTGRMSRMLDLERVPTKAALARGVAHAFPGHNPGTVVSIGSHGFAVLELRGADHQVYRENSRCSQGTGNFLRQLVERFDLSVPEASELCAGVEDPAALSGRCPVILKTDMTHLANKGEARARILAGLYDAVCENVQVLLRPRLSPPRVLLTGGVTRSQRVRDRFREFLTARTMSLVEAEVDDCLHLEALGAALVAAERGCRTKPVDALMRDDVESTFERVPSLRDSLCDVQRMPAISFESLVGDTEPRRLILGFDIGSTGSKVLALDIAERRPVWEGYLNTLGNPVGAAQKLAARFLEETGGRHEVRAVGATGSGREIVGSLMSSCFGTEPVFVLNEIAAHSEGALHFDDEVDTIFEIGGQDAKYIRLDGGRICDAAMNEACSAGTGSFIEEQGKKFQGVDSVVQMGCNALEADHGISLGQHCSVFMAEVIDEAVSAGMSQDPILAGIYDSIVQNYLNRVKGNRSVGRKIFCQGMPFMSDALAAAVARQTGREVVVPPNPGTIGALGIALLAAKEVDLETGDALDVSQFLSATIDRKDTFVCKSKRGCGEPGNKCRIDRIRTTVAGRRQRFIWGGNCSLFDAGTHRRKLPDLAPDPFQERAALRREIAEKLGERRDLPLVSMTDEFALKGLLPFFATFVHELGFDVEVISDAGQKALKRGIEEATVPFCAPMQLYQGVLSTILERGKAAPDYLLVPRVRDLPRRRGDKHSTTCPIVQGSPDIVRKLAGDRGRTTILTPRVDMAEGNLASDRFRSSTRELAEALGRADRWQHAHAAGRRAQETFDAALRKIGERAIAFAHEHDVVPVVVLGRDYTIDNTLLNSNVPNLLREQGTLAIPVDCYPVSDAIPSFENIYWGYSQINLRAAHQIRRTPGVYAVFCSNYSCGPDSFNLHFFSYAMENKPFAIIETDGHSGDAGTKTRIEAFLYCVEGDRRLDAETRDARICRSFKAIEDDKISVADAKRRDDLLLIPRMGSSAPEVLAEVFKAEGFRAECLPMPTRDSLRIGRRYTSGKECVPMTITAGSLLERLERERGNDEHFAFFMPTGDGPCRFGVYNLLHKIIIEKTGWKDRVRVVSPSDRDYFAGVSPDFRIRAFVGMAAADILLAGLHDVRPVERRAGAAQQIFDRYYAELKQLARATEASSLVRALGELPNGMYGMCNLLRRAARELAAIKDFSRDIPKVAVVGEIYVRLDPFANDFVIDKLEERGLKVLLAPFSEWLEYITATQVQRIREGRPIDGDNMARARFTHALEIGTVNRLYQEMSDVLGWPTRTSVEDSLRAAQPYLDKKLMGEAVLSLGAPVHEHEHGVIDGVVIIGPHECMPNKVAEAQYAHIGEEKGLISLTLPMTGDPIDPEVLDRFAFEVKQRHATGVGKKRPHKSPFRVPSNPGAFVQTLQGRALLSALRVLRPFGGRQEAS